MKYMVLVHSKGEDFDLRDADVAEMQPVFEFMAKLNAELAESGELVDAAGLTGPRQAKTVRKRDGVAVTTDGPYAESKEVLGGYWVLDCASEERVLEIAARVVEFEGGPEELEIRPFPEGK